MRALLALSLVLGGADAQSGCRQELPDNVRLERLWFENATIVRATLLSATRPRPPRPP